MAVAPQALFSLVLLFCSGRPVPRHADELPEHVSSDEDDIEGNERVECESDILICKTTFNSLKFTKH